LGATGAGGAEATGVAEGTVCARDGEGGDTAIGGVTEGVDATTVRPVTIGTDVGSVAAMLGARETLSTFGEVATGVGVGACVIVTVGAGAATLSVVGAEAGTAETTGEGTDAGADAALAVCGKESGRSGAACGLETAIGVDAATPPCAGVACAAGVSTGTATVEDAIFGGVPGATAGAATAEGATVGAAVAGAATGGVLAG